MANLAPPEMIATQEELQRARIPVQDRDFCAHLLIPLNKCRREHYYLPWYCEKERHSYEKCEYVEYKRRILKKQLETEGSS